MKKESVKTAQASDAEVEEPSTNKVILTRSERRKMLNCVWKRIEREVGVGLFMDILDRAAKSMLNDIEDQVDYGGVIVERSILFDSEGELTEAGKYYVNAELGKVIHGHSGEWTSDHELRCCLVHALDQETFAFFENERAVQESLDVKGAKKRSQ